MKINVFEMGSNVYFQNQKYEKIKKQLDEQKSLFVDNTFPATSSALGSAIDILPESETVEWKRPRDLCDNPKLVCDGRGVTSITAGALSSQWFFQALQVLAGIKELLYKVIVSCTEQDFSLEKYAGIFHFRFWRYSHWVEVTIDDSLPCSEGKLLFAQFSENGQFWPCLVEKAYAKLLGSYGELDEGHISDALVDFTGGVTEIVDLRASEIYLSEDSRSHLFQSLSSEMSDHSIICATIPAIKQDDMGEKTQEGLIKGTMYHVTAIKKLHISDIKLRNLFKGREKLAVIRVRDSRGGLIYSSASSPTRSTDSSPEEDAKELTATQLTKMLSKKEAWAKLKNEDHGRFGLTIDHEGELWMPFEDFTKYFQELVIVRLYNFNIFTLGRQWRDNSFHGVWAPTHRSGGGNIQSDSFFQNPQYFIDINNDDEDIVLQLLQEGGNEPSSASSGKPRHRLLAIGVTIFEVEGNRKYRLHRQWGFTPMTLTLDHQRRREISYRGNLSRGRFLIVPSTFRPGSEGRFLLRLITQSSVNLRHINADSPSEPCGLSCIASPALWVTVLAIKSVTGLPTAKHVFCSVKCEKQTARTAISKDSNGENVTWDDALVFFRKKPEKAITIKVYNHNTITRNELLGMVEIQARVNHAPTKLEVNLVDKEGGLLSERLLLVEILTEDDLMSV